jgi:chromosome transmission fidelity protein 18
MRSVLGANEKPNCLIIDEIDGAPAVSPAHRSVPALLLDHSHLASYQSNTSLSLSVIGRQAAISILLATLNRKDSQGAESEAEPLKKKKKKESVLLRPIICICNDL